MRGWTAAAVGDEQRRVMTPPLRLADADVIVIEDAEQHAIICSRILEDGV